MSKQTYDELVIAGAPELPKRYFYRIKYGPFRCTVNIQIRKRHRGWFSTLETETSFYLKEALRETVDRGDVLDLMVWTMQRVNGKWRNMYYNEDRLRTFESFMGDHP